LLAEVLIFGFYRSAFEVGLLLLLLFSQSLLLIMISGLVSFFDAVTRDAVDVSSGSSQESAPEEERCCLPHQREREGENWCPAPTAAHSIFYAIKTKQPLLPQPSSPRRHGTTTSPSQAAGQAARTHASAPASP
jgi:hypothetical protein